MDSTIQHSKIVIQPCNVFIDHLNKEVQIPLYMTKHSSGKDYIHTTIARRQHVYLRGRREAREETSQTAETTHLNVVSLEPVDPKKKPYAPIKEGFNLLYIALNTTRILHLSHCTVPASVILRLTSSVELHSLHATPETENQTQSILSAHMVTCFTNSQA